MTFQKLYCAIESLADLENVDTKTIGQSVCGKPIRAFHVGKSSGAQIIVTGAIHAREWITALLVAELVKIYAADFRAGDNTFSENYNSTFDDKVSACDKKSAGSEKFSGKERFSGSKAPAGGIWFVPLCNPDGVKIALDGLNGGRRHNSECKSNFDGSLNCGDCGVGANCGGDPLWKANARGVDLNVNFDADWGLGTGNVRTAGAENFIGDYPNSEPEVKALIDFTLWVKPAAVAAYHSKGEVIYYGFESSCEKEALSACEKKTADDCENKAEPERSMVEEDFTSGTETRLLCAAALAETVAKVTGYTPVKTENSAGGYSDWVSLHLGIPAVTIEVGRDEYPHPIGIDKLPEILAQNKPVPAAILVGISITSQE